MADERNYIIPLRREWLKAARYRRSKKAVSAVRSFVQKHMKTEDVRVGRFLNMELWSGGMKNPPHKVAVKVTRVEEKDATYVKVELAGAPEEKPVEKKKKDLATRLKERVTGKEEKPKVEKVKKEKKEKPTEVKEKVEEKKEVEPKKEISKDKEGK